MSIIQLDTENWGALVDRLSAEQIRDLGKAVFDQMENNKEKMAVLTRCPICNKHLKPQGYKPSIVQADLCFDIISMHQNGFTHVHIKSSLKPVAAEHRDHTIVGDITNHYSKMLYLGLIERCDEDGNALEHFAPIDERDDGDGKLSRFKVGKVGYDFLHGKRAINRVSILNQRVVNVEEDKDVEYRIGELKHFEKRGWQDKCAKYTLAFPEDLLDAPPVVVLQGTLFETGE